MPRPAVHDTEALLDVALSLVVAHGPQGLSVAELARRAEVPSGSVYHRFPSRSALLGALWWRTVHRFQAGWLEALADPDPVHGRIRAACHVLDRALAEPDEARALDHGAWAYDRSGWPVAVRADVRAQAEHAGEALLALARRTPGEPSVMPARLRFAVIDTPAMVLRPHLREAEPVPAGTRELVVTCARTLGGTRPDG